MMTLDHESMALIEEHVRRLLAIMDFPAAVVHCQIQTRPSSESTEERLQLQVEIEAGEAGKRLIGAQGSHLICLQHVVRCLLRQQLPAGAYIVVDVNGYWARRERSLANLAESTARRAQRTGRTVVLRPMTPVDRRAIHMALAARGDVRTESMGDEPNRRVVVRPVFL